MSTVILFLRLMNLASLERSVGLVMPQRRLSVYECTQERSIIRAWSFIDLNLLLLLLSTGRVILF
jgi:hypothetical protein